MECPEKKNLQQKCIFAWDQYDTAIKNVAGGNLLMKVAPEFLRLYGDRLKASGDLSRHLHSHRC
jgi:hypothetical protein